jgi:hypothetical protein
VKARIFHSILACWLSLLLLFGSTAKEFVHSFTGHQDTIHHHHGKGELSFESQHHHCEFLSFVLAPFDHVVLLFIPTLHQPDIPAVNAPTPQHLAERPLPAAAQRGPPAL